VSECVLDASALLASLRRESGAAVVEDLLSGPGATMSTVNLSEVVARLIEAGWSELAIRRDISRLNVDLVPFDATDAFETGLLRPLTRQVGLSLGDRACLALAQRLGLPAVTADRSWTTLQLPITVQSIR